MAQELTKKDVATRRLRTCVERFPNAESGEYNSKCCRFPKNCSPYASIEAFYAGDLTESDLEPPKVPFTTPYAPLMTETKKLRQMRVGSSFMVKVEMLDQRDTMALELNARRVDMEAYVLQEHLADDYYEGRSEEYAFPSTWWDMFKETYGHRWWLNWWYKRHGAKYDHKSFPVRVKVERYASYPEADIEVPRLGRPIPYENLRRLTYEEMKDMDDQTQVESEDEERRSAVVVYSLIPETFDDLVDETGLDRKWFEDAYAYDQEFGLQSKIYIVPV